MWGKAGCDSLPSLVSPLLYCESAYIAAIIMDINVAVYDHTQFIFPMSSYRVLNGGFEREGDVASNFLMFQEKPLLQFQNKQAPVGPLANMQVMLLLLGV